MHVDKNKQVLTQKNGLLSFYSAHYGVGLHLVCRRLLERSATAAAAGSEGKRMARRATARRRCACANVGQSCDAQSRMKRKQQYRREQYESLRFLDCVIRVLNVIDTVDDGGG
eukprot:6201765-Pleurochrysis_carterae.AAC.1